MKRMNTKKDFRLKPSIDWDKVLICGVSLGIMASVLCLLLILTAKLTV